MTESASSLGVDGLQDHPGAAQALATIAACLQSSRMLLQKEAAFALSNLTALPRSQGVHLVRTRLPQLTSTLHALLLSPPTALEVRKEVGYTVANICCGGDGSEGDPVAITELASQGGLKGFLDLVGSADPEAAALGLQFLEMAARAVPETRHAVEQLGGIETIRNVQLTLPNDERVKQMALALINK